MKLYVYEDFSKDEEMFDVINYWGKSKYCVDWNKLVADEIKMKQVVLLLRICLLKAKGVFAFERW